MNGRCMNKIAHVIVITQGTTQIYKRVSKSLTVIGPFPEKISYVLAIRTCTTSFVLPSRCYGAKKVLMAIKVLVLPSTGAKH